MIIRTKYNPKEIESKWQAQWEADQQYHASDNAPKPKFSHTGAQTQSNDNFEAIEELLMRLAK